MIPKPYIAQWKDHAPWSINEQVEQDLIISRTLVALFSDDFLRENLAFRGGTALHKLYLNPAPRYSEDIDLVQIKEGPIKPILKRIGEVIDFFEEERVVKVKANNNTLLYRFYAEYAPDIRLRLKIEINCREHFNVLEWQSFPFEVNSDWFTGKAEITTYHINELLGTKLRALYQRSKGRDLFDLFYADQHIAFDRDQLIHCYQEYMAFVVGKPPTAKQFLLNLEEKQENPDFTGDLEGLLRPGITYDADKAFEWVKTLVEDGLNLR
ncbi:nucleotidyl transferase AbiEii/AbiGii toxin family protein [Catalinimonas sp. 4WD22]|uniref:nucleotidyl transferase AbiEii/AbiGii toxin family protein n=1 Tax=Catalinimonas locisalis TaxID=3133978 RepID=UPI003100BAE5